MAQVIVRIMDHRTRGMIQNNLNAPILSSFKDTPIMLMFLNILPRDFSSANM